MLASLPSELLQALRLTVVVFVVTGLIYPFVGTGLAQALFNHQANGSLITKNGQVVGSSLIGQQFTSDKYFHGRPSATVNPSTGKPAPSDPTQATHARVQFADGLDNSSRSVRRVVIDEDDFPVDASKRTFEPANQDRNVGSLVKCWNHNR